MPSFTYTARDLAGRRVRGTAHAAGEAALEARLGREDLVLVESRPVRARGRGRSDSRALIEFSYHLATVLESGVPLLEGLRDLAADRQNALSPQLDELAARVESGASLSEALAEQSDVFPPLVRSLVAAGEESGRLDEILRDLVRHLEWRQALRRQVASAVVYPALVTVGMIGLGALLTTVVLPNFIGIFRSLDVQLPWITRALLATHGFLAAHGLGLLIGLAGAAVAVALLRRLEAVRMQIDAAWLRVPVLGSLVSMVEMSRLSHNLGLLYGAGVPILRALDLVQQVVQNRVIRGALVDARERVARGELLSETLPPDLVPSLVRRMIRLGETSGRLEESLGRVAAHYDREVPARIERLLVAFNTGAIVGLGAMLTWVVLGIFVPLYEMMGSLGAT